MNRFVRIGAAVAIVALLAAGGWWGRTKFRGSEGKKAEPGAADLHVVGTGPVDLALKETGVVLPRQTVAVKSKVSGKIREVLVAEGQAVRSGQLVAIVEPDATASVTLAAKRMELRRLKLDLDQKLREWKRQKRLEDEGLATGKVAEEAERDWRSAENEFVHSKTALNLVEREANQPETTEAQTTSQGAVELTDYRILAPIDGIVATVKVKPGELAMSGTTGFSQEGALLMEIADQSTLEVVVNVNEIDVPKIHAGMPASITLAARPGRPVAGKVDRVAVAPVTDANKLVVFPVHISLPERPPELRQGMTATVDLTLESRADVLRIPVLAYREKEGKSLVRLQVAGGKLEDREVVIGLRSDRFLEVSKGLAPKDVILARYPKDEEKKPD
jgi:macrolide-specific efflux system membrane fusion protein